MLDAKLIEGVEKIQGEVIKNNLPKLTYEWYCRIIEEVNIFTKNTGEICIITIVIEVDTVDGDIVDIITEDLKMNKQTIKDLGDDFYRFIHRITQQKIENDVQKRIIYKDYLNNYG